MVTITISRSFLNFLRSFYAALSCMLIEVSNILAASFEKSGRPTKLAFSACAHYTCCW